MNKRSLNILEFNKVLEMLRDKADSIPGKALCMSLMPSDSPDEIRLLQQNTEDALLRIIKKGSVSFSGNKEINSALSLIEKGSSVHAGELLNIASVLDNVNRVKTYLNKEDPDIPDDSLDPLFLTLDPLFGISSEIRRCILSEDEIADDASAELKSIRRHIKSAGDKIHSELSRMVNNTYRTYLQDPVITMRNGRYCIPVKAEYKSSVPGMIHDQSSTASTLFIEPSAVVDLNNEIRRLTIDESKEIEIILSGLSALCSEKLSEIRQDIETLTKLDLIFAKASLALDMNATRPIYNTEGRIQIRKGRHPLLDKNKVVPIDISLGDTFDLLIITGPNTGGKTVALKTVGLLSIMGQAGLHIPALERSELPVFNEIFADIGDEQSIEQSLSTFSSHMRTIVEILDKADIGSLCLFDELGAGTDPTEGAALAISILSDLHKKGIRSIATTHYSELKVYALNTPGVENACCEFDVETLRPTYRFLIGIAGKSNAFAIAKRLGLPEHIIDEAKIQLTTKDEAFEDVLSRLERDRITIENERLEIERYKGEIEALKKDYESKQKKLNDSRDKILREASEEARDILLDAKDTADKTIRDFNKALSGNADIKDLEKKRSGLRQKINKVQTKNTSPVIDPVKKSHKLSDFKLGESVRIISTGMKGTISSIPDQKGNLFVQCGIMRMQATMDDIEFLETVDISGPGIDDRIKNRYKPRSAGGLGRSLSKSSSLSTEINLLGRTVDEALSELDKYLDDAYLSHLQSVRIVHGKGTGALRNGIHQYLKKVRYIKSFRLAEYGEGDSGVTIVEFK